MISFVLNSFKSRVVFGKDTPIRIGNDNTLSEEYVFSGEFDLQYVKSDAIAEVVITEWYGEDDVGDKATYFRAVVVDSMKGSLLPNSRILIRQRGNGAQTINGFPLYKNGNRMLVFLRKIPRNPKSDMLGTLSFELNGNPNLYEPLSGSKSILDIVEADGTKFAAK